MYEYQKNYLKMIIEQRGECKYIGCPSCPLYSKQEHCREKLSRELKKDVVDVFSEDYVVYCENLLKKIEGEKNESNN